METESYLWIAIGLLSMALWGMWLAYQFKIADAQYYKDKYHKLTGLEVLMKEPKEKNE